MVFGRGHRLLHLVDEVLVGDEDAPDDDVSRQEDADDHVEVVLNEQAFGPGW